LFVIQAVSKADLQTTCESLINNGSLLYNPCGLIANSYFTGAPLFTASPAILSRIILPDLSTRICRLLTASSHLHLPLSDVFTVNTGASNPSSIVMEEDDIAWASDKEKFKQPKGFVSKVITAPSSCAAEGMPTNCKYYLASDGTQYYYSYPNDDTVQYLYETYPDHISPIIGVTDQHFKVWMRPAALPQFRKLYGTFHCSHFIVCM